MGWKHVDTLHMRPTSVTELVENVAGVKSIKEEVESRVETEKKTERKTAYVGIVRR